MDNTKKIKRLLSKKSLTGKQAGELLLFSLIESAFGSENGRLIYLDDISEIPEKLPTEDDYNLYGAYEELFSSLARLCNAMRSYEQEFLHGYYRTLCKFTELLEKIPLYLPELDDGSNFDPSAPLMLGKSLQVMRILKARNLSFAQVASDAYKKEQSRYDSTFSLLSNLIAPTGAEKYALTDKEKAVLSVLERYGKESDDFMTPHLYSSLTGEYAYKLGEKCSSGYTLAEWSEILMATSADPVESWSGFMEKVRQEALVKFYSTPDIADRIIDMPCSDKVDEKTVGQANKLLSLLSVLKRSVVPTVSLNKFEAVKILAQASSSRISDKERYKALKVGYPDLFEKLSLAFMESFPKVKSVYIPFITVEECLAKKPIFARQPSVSEVVKEIFATAPEPNDNVSLEIKKAGEFQERILTELCILSYRQLVNYNATIEMLSKVLRFKELNQLKMALSTPTKYMGEYDKKLCHTLALIDPVYRATFLEFFKPLSSRKVLPNSKGVEDIRRKLTTAFSTADYPKIYHILGFLDSFVYKNSDESQSH